MLYKEEFLNIYENKETKELIELLSILVEHFEKKFNKDLSQFTAEEVKSFSQGIKKHEKHREVISLIITYRKLFKELSIVKCEWKEVDVRKQIE
jgi:hypothetical protein